MDLPEDEENKDNNIEKNTNNNVNIYSSDSETENENLSENISSIPKEFNLELSNKEWVVTVDANK